MADVGCRNTVFGAQAQTDPSAIAQWQDAGVRHFRLEFVYQSTEQIQAIATAFQSHLAKKSSAGALAEVLRANSPQATTPGSLFVPEGFGKLVELK